MKTGNKGEWIFPDYGFSISMPDRLYLECDEITFWTQRGDRFEIKLKKTDADPLTTIIFTSGYFEVKTRVPLIIWRKGRAQNIDNYFKGKRPLIPRILNILYEKWERQVLKK
jgi:hypothetical protein